MILDTIELGPWRSSWAVGQGPYSGEWDISVTVVLNLKFDDSESER